MNSRLKQIALRAVPRKNEVNAREIGLGECFEEIERPLPGLQFCAIQNDTRVLRDSPARADGRAIAFCVSRYPPFLVHPATNNSKALLGNTERQGQFFRRV